MGQDQVIGGESILSWLAATVLIFYFNLPDFLKKFKVGDDEK